MTQPIALIVDDEASVLRSLHRGLRRHFRDWELILEESAESALKQLKTKQPWIVISDKRMPGMDGVELLTRVRQQAPLAVRVMISGETITSDSLPAFGVAHLMLPKPFNMDDLISALQAARSLHELPVPFEVREEIGCISSLPVLPSVYTELVQYLDSTREPENSRIAQIISHDMAILSKILQMSNSAYFGFASPASSATDAVVRLGHTMIKNLVLVAGIFKEEANESLHSALCAQAEEVCGIMVALANIMRLPPPEADIHFIIGMLHNVGGLISGELGEYSRNALISGYLLKLWGFDSETVRAVLHYANPKRSPQITPLMLRLHAATTLYRCHHSGKDPLAEDSGLDKKLLTETGILPAIEALLNPQLA
ncbi:HDOD domain-containing protein [Pontibacterium granulatum]|uniref:HDOD domain-containing protein n=1 Tax=Pontibacterium granulatum TaxID=2036029 RepID=UPI00249B5C15|nr:HDOD domain-containing protein [Pontibacterium granulatum]MDI3324952.1 HDOD domain-containing protein [Pontibacterium granulatum]